jgi:hypothetical protein
MEFKGTKGKWEIKRNPTRFPSSLTDEIVDKNGDVLFKVFLANNDIEYKANSQLISCAPEMLDMLKEFITKCDNGMPHDEDLYNRIEQLIKKATEI